MWFPSSKFFDTEESLQTGERSGTGWRLCVVLLFLLSIEGPSHQSLTGRAPGIGFSVSAALLGAEEPRLKGRGRPESVVPALERNNVPFSWSRVGSEVAALRGCVGSARRDFGLTKSLIRSDEGMSRTRFTLRVLKDLE